MGLVISCNLCERPLGFCQLFVPMSVLNEARTGGFKHLCLGCKVVAMRHVLGSPDVRFWEVDLYGTIKVLDYSTVGWPDGPVASRDAVGTGE